MILDSPIISGSLTQQAGQTAEIPRYTAVSSSFLAASASFDARIDSIESTTASFSPRINALESFTASVDGAYVNASGDSMSGNLTITGSLVVTDRITAQEFHTEYVSSSVVFQSGSTKFGDSGDDVHSFTGSLKVDGNVIASNLNGIFSSSAQLTSSLGDFFIISGTITQTTWDNIASKPGGIVSGSSQVVSLLPTGVVSGSSQITYSNISSIPANIVSGAMQVTESLDVRYRLIGASVAYSDISNRPTLISSSLQFTSSIAPFTGSFSGSFVGNGSLLTGLAAGAKFHTQSTPSSTWTFIHNLSTQYPNVTVYDSNNNIVLPQSITATNANTLVLEFGGPVSGYATAGIGGIIEVNGRTIKQYFTSSLNWRFEHNIGDRFINIQTFDGGYEKIIPQTIALTDATSSAITFPEATEGWAVGTIGGDLPSISSSYGGYVLQVSNGAPYTASWTAVANVTASNAVNALTASYLNPISQSLIPAVSGAYDLGSQSNPWKHIYVGTGSIYLVDNAGTIVKTLTGDTIVTNDNLSSLNAFTASNFTTNTFTSSTTARLNSIETITSSNVARLNAVEIVSASNIARLNAVEIVSASNIARIGSIETITSSNVARLNSLEIKTGSLATTGSNTFMGTQTITGSLYISSDLVVQGSSSLQNITASAVSIGTNIVNLNTANPAIRYAGLVIGDSGSIGSSGSFFYDSVQDEMIFIHRGANTTVTSSVVLMGPQTYDNVGNETYPTSNYIQKGTGNEHLVDSSIIDTGTQVSMFSNALFISSSNRVGINTPIPSTALTVIGNIKAGYESATGMIIGLAPSGIPANDVNSYILWGDAASFGGNNGDLIYIPRTSTTADHRFYTGNGTPTEKLRITHNGLVGVGTNAPLSKFDVALSSGESFTIGNCSNAISCGDLIGALTFVSRDASTNSTGGIAGIRSYATQTYNTGGVEGDLRFYTSIVNTQPNGTILSGSEVLKLSQDGVACFCGKICTPHLIGLNNVSIGSSCTSSDGYNTRLRITNIPNDTFVFSFNNQACRAIMYMYGGNINNPQGYTSWLDNTSGNVNHTISHNTAENTSFAALGGKVGIGTSTPCSILTLRGTDLASFTSTSLGNLFLQTGAYDASKMQSVDFGSATYPNPLARIAVKICSNGSHMMLGTSNDYSPGITNCAIYINWCGNVGLNTDPSNEKFVIYGGSGHGNVFLRLKTDGCHGIKPAIHFDSGLVGTNRASKVIIMGGYSSPDSGAGGALIIYTNDTNETSQQRMCIDPRGAVTIMGALAKGSGSFRICHPLPSKVNTHALVHSFIEGPNADLIYSGHIKLTNGVACINIDCSARMTQGTFEALNRCVRIFTTNETSWDAVKGKVCGNMVVIESQNNTSEDEISWMVIGERQDQHMFDTEWTDDEGKVITEPELVIVNDNDII